jgi:hypothetical protein
MAQTASVNPPFYAKMHISHEKTSNGEKYVPIALENMPLRIAKTS